MFYATLVAHDQSADPIALDELSNCRIFLDTNILVIGVLGGHRHHEALKRLISTLQDLGNTVCYFKETADEYDRLLTARHVECKRLWRTFEADVVGDVDDSFVHEAIDRGVTDLSDIDTLFAELSDMPATVREDYGVELCDSSKLLEVIEQGKSDRDAVHRVRKAWEDRRAEPKTDAACRHDAGVAAAVDYVRRSWKVQSLKGCGSWQSLWAIYSSLFTHPPLIFYAVRYGA